MKKANVLWVILNLIFLIIFNVIFYVLGGSDHNLSVWISYGFIHISYIMLLVTPKLTRKGKSASLFGFSLYSMSTAYFLFEFVVGIVFILIAPESINAALLVQLCIAGLYGILLLANMISNERTAEAEEKRQIEIAYVKDASIKLKSLLARVDDKEIKKNVERVYDAVSSSPAKTHPALAQIESSIVQSINELEYAALAGNKGAVASLANTVLASVNERNMRLKSLN